MTTPGADELRRAAAVLRRGGVLLYPTETVYGFGCDAANPAACELIGRLKGWAGARPMLVLVEDVAQAETVARWAPAARALAERYWPGPLTLVLSDRAGEGTVGIRLSPHPVARALVRDLGRPLTSTSANRTGEPPPRTLADASWHGSRGPELALDGGPCPGRLGSTVVDCTGSRPRVIRRGDLEVELDG